MPNRDGTGPDGLGPRTGRGLGPCGCGLRRGGRGGGRGLRLCQRGQGQQDQGGEQGDTHLDSFQSSSGVKAVIDSA